MDVEAISRLTIPQRSAPQACHVRQLMHVASLCGGLVPMSNLLRAAVYNLLSLCSTGRAAEICIELDL
eukprot:8532815-Pyramimonas_sp.AAC.1